MQLNKVGLMIVMSGSSVSFRSQVEGLQAAVEAKGAELISLRKTLEHKEAQVCVC